LPLAVAAAIASFVVASSLGLASIMVQQSVPDELRGRVTSLYSLALTGAMPFATLGVRLADVIVLNKLVSQCGNARGHNWEQLEEIAW
jgi:MFS family permease